MAMVFGACTATRSPGETPAAMETIAVRQERIVDGSVETRTRSEIVTRLGEVESSIGSLSPKYFAAFGGKDEVGIQAQMVENLQKTSSYVTAGDDSMALFVLKSTIKRFDGESDAPDAMSSGTEKKRIFTELMALYDEITKLQASV